MIFLALPTFFTDASGLLRVQEHAGIITPPIVQIARTASVFIQASAKKPHYFSVSPKCSRSLFRTRRLAKASSIPPRSV
jgi:hypothetical protein